MPDDKRGFAVAHRIVDIVMQDTVNRKTTLELHTQGRIKDGPCIVLDKNVGLILKGTNVFIGEAPAAGAASNILTVWPFSVR